MKVMVRIQVVFRVFRVGVSCRGAVADGVCVWCDLHVPFVRRRRTPRRASPPSLGIHLRNLLVHLGDLCGTTYEQARSTHFRDKPLIALSTFAMASSTPLLSFLRPLGLPRPSTIRHFLRFTPLSRAQSQQASPPYAARLEGTLDDS